MACSIHVIPSQFFERPVSKIKGERVRRPLWNPRFGKHTYMTCIYYIHMLTPTTWTYNIKTQREIGYFEYTEFFRKLSSLNQ